MASNINPDNIDGTYPIERVNNDSQGFRTNFTNTSSNFTITKAEIEDLQSKSILKEPLIGEGTTTNTLTVPINLAASTTILAGLNIAEGIAPASPVDGDVWVTAAGEFNAQLDGVTVDLADGGGGVPAGGTVGQILIKQSGTDGDATWEDQGSTPASATEYCPGYDYTRVDDNEFTVDLVDAANLFRVGRRVKFDVSGTFDYGSISAVDYNSTSPNDTHVTLTMEGADTVPVGSFDVCLVSGTTAWSGATQWWVAVGAGGKLATSTDAGLNWTVRVTGTVENLNAVGYAADIEEFLAGGDAGVVLDSSNGTTWTLDTTSLPALATTGNSNVQPNSIFRFDGALVQWALKFQYATTANAVLRDAGTLTWAGPGLTLSTSFICYSQSNDPQGNSMFVQDGTDDVGILSDPSDVSSTNYLSSAWLNLEPMTYFEGHGVLTNRIFTLLSSAGSIACYSNTSQDSNDNLTFIGTALRGAVYSPLHTRTVIVGDTGAIGWIDDSGRATADNVTAVTNGFNPLANILAVDWNETDGIFIAVADNGQIARSTNGTN